ncbi:hypothetical protein J0X15_13200 [Roseibium sp. CAU 1637]|uniref:YfdX protein n=1 Tax=Roseibium limicola TaxID=2816037 RepID=A0A939EPJ7_9HYPH|nr:hypothetical protein [Roseibium limicola]MBO0346183.1 hypothetical protein [Roseibium limicola]
MSTSRNIIIALGALALTALPIGPSSLTSQLNLSTVAHADGDDVAKTINKMGYKASNFLGKTIGGALGIEKSRPKTARRPAANGLNTKQRASLATVSILPPEHPGKEAESLETESVVTSGEVSAEYSKLDQSYRVYMTSEDPGLEKVQAYIEASIAQDEARENFVKADADVQSAVGAFRTRLSKVRSYDGTPYDDATLESAATRLSELKAIDKATISVTQAVYLDGEIVDLTAALDSPEAENLAEALSEYTAAQAAASSTDATAVSDATLKSAILSASSKPGSSVSDEDATVDEATLAWAKSLLGVGAAHGKIDEIKAARTSQIVVDEEDRNATTELKPIE